MASASTTGSARRGAEEPAGSARRGGAESEYQSGAQLR